MDMTENSIALSTIFDGWDGYQTSIVHSIQPLSRQQLIWRPAPELRSVGEVASHIALGRVDWFARMPAPGSLDLEQQAAELGSRAAISRAVMIYQPKEDLECLFVVLRF
jgi:hypothetical protein